MKRFNAVVLSVLLAIAVTLPMTAQLKDSDSPILEARDISGGCCQPSRDTTYLRVFPDGKAEWDEFNEAKKSYVAHQAVLSKKQMRAVKWAIDNMKDCQAPTQENPPRENIDSFYSFAIRQDLSNGNILRSSGRWR
jgi:hypothetical protein